jgi:glyoxylase-like metal-dependent hydrolase (beta-lactamase superfamily II)
MMGLPIADEWYRTEPRDHGVILIDEFNVEPIARSNIWLVKGADRDLLVDSGTGVGPLRQLVESLSCHPIVAFATLGYYDHAGGLHQFDERIIHRCDADRVMNPTPRKVATERYVGWAFKALPYPGFGPTAYAVPASLPTALVDDGDVIDLGDRQFEVIHLPGITSGTSGLYERETGIVFTGDALSYDRGYVYDGEPRECCDDADAEAFRSSLRRLASLPLLRVFPGHFECFDGDRLVEIVDDYLQGRTLRSPP